MRDLSVASVDMFGIPAARVGELLGRAIDTIDMEVEFATVTVAVGLVNRAEHHPAIIRQRAAEAQPDIVAVDGR